VRRLLLHRSARRVERHPFEFGVQHSGNTDEASSEGRRPSHRFGTDLLDARADRRQFDAPIYEGPSGKETHGDNSESEHGGPHGAVPLDTNGF
jgi:hypothetical protein